MNPIHSTASDPILRETQNTVHPGISTNSAVICIMLNIKTDKGEEKPFKTCQIPLVTAGRVDVNLPKHRKGYLNVYLFTSLVIAIATSNPILNDNMAATLM